MGEMYQFQIFGGTTLVHRTLPFFQQTIANAFNLNIEML